MTKDNLNISKLSIIVGLCSLLFPALFLHLGHSHPNNWDIEWQTMRFVAWIISMSLFVGVILLIGFNLKGRVLGVLINERNRYSLSRLQMMLWSILVLTGLYVVLLNNVYEPGDANATFSFDWQLLVLLGMSVGSVVSTPMILKRKTDDISTASLFQANIPQEKVAVGMLNTKSDESAAALSDLILGEEISNTSCIDIGRIQMLMMTLMAVVIYGWLIGGALILEESYIAGMPKLNETLLGLILVSHIGYLTGKIAPTSVAKEQTVSDLSRILLLSQKATDQVHRAELVTKDAATNNTLKTQIAYLLPLIQSLSSEVASLSSQIGTDKFDNATISRLEGKYEALSNHLSATISNIGTIRNVTDAPNPNIVRDVQMKLVARGMPLVVSGVVDSSTYSAIDKYLADKQISRADLSAEPYRMFEELQSILI